MQEISIDSAGDMATLRVSGSIDALSCASLEAAIRDQIEAGRHRLVLDLGGVEFISSTGLRLILSGTKQARQRGGDVRLAAIPPGVRRVLDLSGFLGLIKTFVDADAATASYRD